MVHQSSDSPSAWAATSEVAARTAPVQTNHNTASARTRSRG